MNNLETSIVHEWNNLPTTTRKSTSLISFKRKLINKSDFRINTLYCVGKRHGRVNHTRLRLGLSGLNSSRYDYNFITNPSCSNCSDGIEDATNYLIVRRLLMPATANDKRY